MIRIGVIVLDGGQVTEMPVIYGLEAIPVELLVIHFRARLP